VESHSGGDLEHVVDSVARLGRALGVARRLDGSAQLDAVVVAEYRWRWRAPAGRRRRGGCGAGIVAQVGLERDQHDGRARTEVAHLQDTSASGGFKGGAGVRPHPPWRLSEKFMVYQFRKQ